MPEFGFECNYQYDRSREKQPEPKFDRKLSPQEQQKSQEIATYLKGDAQALTAEAQAQLSQILGAELIAKIQAAKSQGAALGKYVPASVLEQSPLSALCHPKWQWRPIANDPARIDAQGNFVPHPEVFVDYDKTSEAGKKGSGLGVGMEILREGACDTIKYADVRGQAFPKTPEGVVQAALYFVHLGEKKTFQEILSDQTRARFTPAETAPQESGSSNNDRALAGTPEAKHEKQPAIAVGHIGTGKHRTAIGPIRAFHEIGNDSYGKDKKKQLPWCGSFAATVYALCGINMGEGIASAVKAPKKLASTPGAVAYERANMNKTKKVKIPQGKDKEGKPMEREILAYEPSSTLSKIKPQTLKKGQTVDDVKVDFEGMKVNGVGMINIGPGFMAWKHHNMEQGHVMIVLATKHMEDGVAVVTAEGNFSDALQTRSYKISYDSKTGAIGGDIAGWGAPPEIAELGWREKPDSAVDDFLNRPGQTGGSEE